jgi:transposase
MIREEDLRDKYRGTFPILDEQQRRIVAAGDAVLLGRGGVSRVARASGLSRTTIHKGIKELEAGIEEEGRVRKEGGGRKRIVEKEPGIAEALEALVEPVSRGDPMSPLRWTCKSTRELAEALQKDGYTISHPVVADLLHGLGYSLQANVKTTEGEDHPDRDEQFQYINRRVKAHLRSMQPVISVDTKKKELIGEYRNPGQEWRKKGSPRKVKTHDFPGPDVDKAIPYGVYDIARDAGWVNVGRDNDTSSFAIESILGWWRSMGRRAYPKATKLLICADSGGSNGYRRRLWKVEIQRFADRTGLKVTVCHFPPGTSKWNKVEHRLFSHISMNWRGQALTSHEVVVNLIGATKTRSGMNVKAKLDKRKYPTKIQVSDEEMEQLKITQHKFHGEWNYTVSPH